MVDFSRRTRRGGCLDVRNVCVDWDDREAGPLRRVEPVGGSS